jgi:hypothetical protein
MCLGSRKRKVERPYSKQSRNSSCLDRRPHSPCDAVIARGAYAPSAGTPRIPRALIAPKPPISRNQEAQAQPTSYHPANLFTRFWRRTGGPLQLCGCAAIDLNLRAGDHSICMDRRVTVSRAWALPFFSQRAAPSLGGAARWLLLARSTVRARMHCDGARHSSTLHCRFAPGWGRRSRSGGQNPVPRLHEPGPRPAHLHHDDRLTSDLAGAPT